VRTGDASQGGTATASPAAASLPVPVEIGAPTAVGSLPHTDRDQAVAFVLDALPELPALPSLPALDPREGMVAQAAWGLAGVAVGADGTLAVDPAALDPEAPLGDAELSGPPFATWRAFLAAVAGRTTPLKLQLTGPVTLARALHRAGVEPGLAVRIAGPAVRARSRALHDAVRAVAPGAPLVAVLDEPGLVGGFPLDVADPETLIDLVSSALALWEPRAVTGIHCCGETDWKALLQTGPRILSAPVGAAFAPGAAALAAFLERDGWIAWGAVPTDRPLGDSASHWWRLLSAQWCELVRAGCDPVRIRCQALVTPACGLAGHRLPQAELVLELSRAVGLRIHDQLAGVRLSVGA